jgi:hypothetical protein
MFQLLCERSFKDCPQETINFQFYNNLMSFIIPSYHTIPFMSKAVVFNLKQVEKKSNFDHLLLDLVKVTNITGEKFVQMNQIYELRAQTLY